MAAPAASEPATDRSAVLSRLRNADALTVEGVTANGAAGSTVVLEAPTLTLAGDVIASTADGRVILRTGAESREIIGVMRQILKMRPALTYQDTDGMFVVEWHTDGGEGRWREVQGQPQYQSLRRLRRD